MTYVLLLMPLLLQLGVLLLFAWLIRPLRTWRFGLALIAFGLVLKLFVFSVSEPDAPSPAYDDTPTISCQPQGVTT